MDLPADQQLRIFEIAIEAIQTRTLKTLSSVTWIAILDRTISQSQQKFPSLFPQKEDASRVSLNALLSELKPQDHDQTVAALRFFLSELLIILENLTGGVLTRPLYEELAQVLTTTEIMGRHDRGTK